jgi:hypothetical protein
MYVCKNNGIQAILRFEKDIIPEILKKKNIATQLSGQDCPINASAE